MDGREQRVAELEARCRELEIDRDGEATMRRAAEWHQADAEGTAETLRGRVHELDRWAEEVWDLLPLNGPLDRERALTYLRRELRQRGRRVA